MRELLREWLSAAGYPVRDSLDSDPRVPDLAIVSVETPKSDSAVVIRALKRVCPGTPIISQAPSQLKWTECRFDINACF